VRIKVGFGEANSFDGRAARIEDGGSISVMENALKQCRESDDFRFFRLPDYWIAGTGTAAVCPDGAALMPASFDGKRAGEGFKSRNPPRLSQFKLIEVSRGWYSLKTVKTGGSGPAEIVGLRRFPRP
jgi:hypothetical protein